MSDPLERVIRPIVEGQIRGFIKEHPSILGGVNWFKPRLDKATTLTNSLAKRIVCDLLCKESRKRIEAAFFEIWEYEKLDEEFGPSSDAGDVGKSSDIMATSERAILSATDVMQVALRPACITPSVALLPSVEWRRA